MPYPYAYRPSLSNQLLQQLCSNAKTDGELRRHEGGDATMMQINCSYDHDMCRVNSSHSHGQLSAIKGYIMINDHLILMLFKYTWGCRLLFEGILGRQRPDNSSCIGMSKRRLNLGQRPSPDVHHSVFDQPSSSPVFVSNSPTSLHPSCLLCQMRPSSTSSSPFSNSGSTSAAVESFHVSS